MDHKSILEQFKNQHVKTGKFFSFSLFPLLFLELKRFGADKTIITEEFIEDLRNILLPNEKTGVILQALKYIDYYNSLPSPVAQPPVKEESKTIIQEYKENPKLDTFTDHIPTEEEEGDGLFIPEEERINLKPEDCSKADWDVEFLDLVGATGFKR